MLQGWPLEHPEHLALDLVQHTMAWLRAELTLNAATTRWENKTRSASNWNKRKQDALYINSTKCSISKNNF